MMVRPSKNNLHEFVAEENTCFFDICLPNYTADSLRRITYFKEITGASAAEVSIMNPSSLGSTPIGNNHNLLSKIDPKTVADRTFQLSS
jgi:hypothetical protein